MKSYKLISILILFQVYLQQAYCQETEQKEEEKKEQNEGDKTDAVSTKEEELSLTEDSDGQLSLKWGNRTINFKKEESDQVIPPILFSLGFNFDFLDGVKANDLYADLSADLPFIFLKKNNEADSSTSDFSALSVIEKFGIEFGVFQRRTISHLDTIPETFQVWQTQSQKVDDDFIHTHYRTIHNTEKISVKSVENLGLFFQPKYTIIYEGDLNKGGNNSGLNLITHFEWLRSKYKSSSTSTVIFIDSATVVGGIPENWDNSSGYLRTAPILEHTSAYDEYNVNIGFGAELFFSRPSGAFKLKTIFGTTNTKTTTTTEDGLNSISKISNYFYLIQSEVMENKILGLKLGV